MKIVPYSTKALILNYEHPSQELSSLDNFQSRCRQHYRTTTTTYTERTTATAESTVALLKRVTRSNHECMLDASCCTRRRSQWSSSSRCSFAKHNLRPTGRPTTTTQQPNSSTRVCLGENLNPFKSTRRKFLNDEESICDERVLH